MKCRIFDHSSQTGEDEDKIEHDYLYDYDDDEDYVDEEEFLSAENEIDEDDKEFFNAILDEPEDVQQAMDADFVSLSALF